LAYTASLFTDYLYFKKPLIKNLKRIFKSNTFLYGETVKLGLKNDVKMVVTVTTINLKAVIFLNYIKEVKAIYINEGDLTKGITV
jgi:hypothetical protein